MFKKYKEWVKQQWYKYNMSLGKQQAESDEKSKKESNNDDFTEGCAGCGCFIIAACFVFIVVSWAWHIHWLFGLLLLFLLLGFL